MSFQRIVTVYRCIETRFEMNFFYKVVNIMLTSCLQKYTKKMLKNIIYHTFLLQEKDKTCVNNSSSRLHLTNEKCIIYHIVSVLFHISFTSINVLSSCFMRKLLMYYTNSQTTNKHAH